MLQASQYAAVACRNKCRKKKRLNAYLCVFACGSVLFCGRRRSFDLCGLLCVCVCVNVSADWSSCVRSTHGRVMQRHLDLGGKRSLAAGSHARATTRCIEGAGRCTFLARGKCTVFTLSHTSTFSCPLAGSGWASKLPKSCKWRPSCQSNILHINEVPHQTPKQTSWYLLWRSCPLKILVISATFKTYPEKIWLPQNMCEACILRRTCVY